MASNSRDKAERCFALARSTKFDGERTNAIAQGTRIAEAAGLSLDLFDIPGRVKVSPSMSGKPGGRAYFDEHHFDTFRRSAYSEQAARDEAFRASWSHMADALKRQADRTRKEQANRDASVATAKAVHYLREQGAEIRLSQLSPHHWCVSVAGRALPAMTSADLIRLADDVRVASEKRAYEAGRQPERCARCGSLITIGVRHLCPYPSGSSSVPRKCPGGCGKTLMFGDSCVECDRTRSALKPCARCGGVELHTADCRTVRS